jgi:hypothetical protein
MGEDQACSWMVVGTPAGKQGSTSSSAKIDPVIFLIVLILMVLFLMVLLPVILQ